MTERLPTCRESEATLQQLLFTSEDAREGLAAYAEKRNAKLEGK